MSTYSNITAELAEQLSSKGWSTADIERLNSQAAERGTTVSFFCQATEQASA